MGEKILAGVALAVCLVLAARLLMRPRQQRRFDAWMVERWAALRWRAHRLRRWRSDREEARRAAEEAIQRAARKGNGRWDGNVHHTDAFKGPKKPH